MWLDFGLLTPTLIPPNRTNNAGLFSFYSMVDIMTVIPIFVMYGRTCPAINASNTPTEVVEFFLCGMQTTRILRALRLRRHFVKIEDEVQRFLANMGLNIVVMLLFSRSFWQLYFRQVVYWILFYRHSFNAIFGTWPKSSLSYM
jgi:hypothetical protein